MKSFTKKLGFDLEKSKEILISNGLIFQEEQSLSQIAKINKVSPKFVYDLLKVNFEKAGLKIVELTGLGKKKVKDVAITLELTEEEFILKLKALGIEAKANDKFKTVAEKYDLGPMDIMEKLGYKKPE